MEPYDKLISVLEVFTDNYDGAIRLRGIKTVLLIQQASIANKGISITEIARVTEAPLESVRRQMVKHVELGYLHYVNDPDDDRITRIVATEQSAELWPTTKVVAGLRKLSEVDGNPPPGVRPVPYAELMEVLDAFIAGYNGRMRTRGIKTALLIQNATLNGTGITISELARSTSAPLETVRRNIADYVERGNLRYVEDPHDDRTTRVMSTHVEVESATAAGIAERLSRIDWRAFD